MTQQIAPETELLCRYPHHFERERLLLVEPPSGEDVRKLQAELPDTDLHIFTTSCAVSDELKGFKGSSKIHVERGAWILPVPTEQSAEDCVIIYLPKGKERLDMLLAMLKGYLAVGAEVFVVGRKKGGVRSALKQIEKRLDEVAKVESACHCSLLYGKIDEREESALKLEDWRTQWSMPDGSLEVVTYPGVFSASALDRGTKMLLEVLDVRDSASVLDMGCGAGVIGATLAKRYPEAQITMCDVSELAVLASRETLALNGLKRVQVVCSDVFSAIPRARFTNIFSNPPFHRGIDTEYGVTERIILESPKHLRGACELWMVVNTFRRCPQTMEQVFKKIDRVRERRAYTIYRARHVKGR